MKRFLADWVGNFVFFVPLVLIFSRAWEWPADAVTSYLTASVLVAAVGGRAYTIFLKWIWYPLWKEEF